MSRRSLVEVGLLIVGLGIGAWGVLASQAPAPQHEAPPAVVASESMVIANCVDAAVLVIRAQQEQRGLVSRLVHQLSDAQCESLGVLLNRPRGTAGGYFKKNFAAMAAYVLAWVKFRGSDFLFFSIFALQVVPLQMALVPLLRLFNFGVHLGPIPIIPAPNLEDGLTFWKVWIAHTMFALPLAIFLMHNFIAQLPREVMESATVDGANHFTIFRRIVLPLATPAIASIAIFQFLWVWNDLLVGLTFLGNNPQFSPITARLSQPFTTMPTFRPFKPGRKVARFWEHGGPMMSRSTSSGVRMNSGVACRAS